MRHFHKHARDCKECYDPYSTYLSGGTLCDQGHRLAKDVAHYVYSKAGKAYSVRDRGNRDQRVQIEIPPNCRRVRGLLEAVDHGLRVQKPAPGPSHDQNYYVPTRPEKRGHYEDRRGGPVKEPRIYRDRERQYYDDRQYRHDAKSDYGERHQYREKRRSLPSDYVPYGNVGEQDTSQRKRRQSYYDGNPVYYYKPSKHGSEMRIPRSESPKREAIRRMYPEDYRSSRHGRTPAGRPSRYDYDYADRYRSSQYSSPDSYYSSRHASPDSHRPSRRTSPESYSSKRRSWSPDHLYRTLFG